MAITKLFDKFDNKWEFQTSLFTLSNTDPRIGIVSSQFGYVIGEGFEVGWLQMYRTGKSWKWLTDNRAILVADNLRIEHTGGLREKEVLEAGNVFERMDIAFTPEQVSQLCEAKELPAIRIDGVVYEFTNAYVAEIRQLLEAVASR
jgi:hypothetical protein